MEDFARGKPRAGLTMKIGSEDFRICNQTADIDNGRGEGERSSGCLLRTWQGVLLAAPVMQTDVDSM